MTTNAAAHEFRSGFFVDRPPVGESRPIPDDSFVTRDIFPPEGEIRVKPLRGPVAAAADGGKVCAL